VFLKGGGLAKWTAGGAALSVEELKQQQLQGLLRNLRAHANDPAGPFRSCFAGRASCSFLLRPWRGCFPRQPLHATTSLRVVGPLPGAAPGPGGHIFARKSQGDVAGAFSAPAATLLFQLEGGGLAGPTGARSSWTPAVQPSAPPLWQVEPAPLGLPASPAERALPHQARPAPNAARTDPRDGTFASPATSPFRRQVHLHVLRTCLLVPI
jgi:hypothetical protein